MFPRELQAEVHALLPPNEQAVAGRLVSLYASRLPGGSRTACFGQPLSPAALSAAWRPHMQQAFTQHTFKDKLGVLSISAASGSATNLVLARRLLHPGLFPELLQHNQGYRYQKPAFYKTADGSPDAGTAAVRAGHAATMLPWLVGHGCPLHPGKTIEAAAQHCDLEDL